MSSSTDFTVKTPLLIFLEISLTSSKIKLYYLQINSVYRQNFMDNNICGVAQ